MALRREHALISRVLNSLERLAGTAGREHRLVALLADAVDCLSAFAEQCHDLKEEAGLLSLADGVLTAAEAADLTRAFAAVEASGPGPGVQAALSALADALEQRTEPGGGRATVVVAADVMRRGIAVLTPAMSLAQAAETMQVNGIHALPVAEAGRLVGIITERDLLPHRGHFEWTAVGTVMTRDPLTVDPTTPVATLARLLRQRGFDALPVVERGALLGMVACRDLLVLLADA